MMIGSIIVAVCTFFLNFFRYTTRYSVDLFSIPVEYKYFILNGPSKGHHIIWFLIITL